MCTSPTGLSGMYWRHNEDVKNTTKMLDLVLIQGIPALSSMIPVLSSVIHVLSSVIPVLSTISMLICTHSWGPESVMKPQVVGWIPIVNSSRRFFISRVGSNSFPIHCKSAFLSWVSNSLDRLFINEKLHRAQKERKKERKKERTEERKYIILFRPVFQFFSLLSYFKYAITDILIAGATEK